MPLIISEQCIKKLKHKIQEIRVRAFREIREKLYNCSEFQNEIIFDGLHLYGAMCDCMKQKLFPDSEILEVILLLFKCKQGHLLISSLGPKRIRQDIQPSSSDAKTISKLSDVLAFLASSVNEGPDATFHKDPEESLIDHSFSVLNISNADYVKCWSRPHPSDVIQFRKIHEIFVHTEDTEGALKLVQNAIGNIPAEQFLQPPYLYKTLMDSLKVSGHESEVLATLRSLTRLLQARIKERVMVHTALMYDEEERDVHNQVAVHAFCYSLFMALMGHLKDVSSHLCQERLNQNFALMFDIVELLKLCNIPDESQSIMRELTFFAKYYRENYENGLKHLQFRTNYLIILKMIATLGTHTPLDVQTDVQLCGPPVKPIWQIELEPNLMDFTLRESYPEIFQQIYHICNASENAQLNAVISCADVLQPAVEILRNPVRWTDEDLVMNGVSVLDSIRITKSIGLVERLIEAVVGCAPNLTLRETCEHLLLCLLANNNVEIKAKVYSVCKEHVKEFFTGMKASIHLGKDERFYYAGIPLNPEILTEIICFGMKHGNPVVTDAANTIITFFVKGKPILGKNWKKFLEILLPVIPLLQAIVDTSSNLGYAVFELFNPDSNLEPIESMHGNLRYLFATDPRIRDEAVLRLIYISSKYPNGDFYMPNLDHIKDTITNTICIVHTPLPLRSGLKRGVYNVQTLSDLINLLKSDDASPNVRHSTLVQINALVDDTDLCDILYRENYWPYILQAFDNSLKAFYHQDYSDTTVPALQIIAKLCIRIAELRRNISLDVDFMFLLVRAIFLHHLDHNFKNDCATLVFILVFADFVIGIDELSFPHALASLKIPFQCEFHFRLSPFEEISLLESVFEAEQPYDGNNNFGIHQECGTMNYQQRSLHRPLPENNLRKQQWRFLRITFAVLWFDGIDNVVFHVDNEKKPTDLLVDYTRTPYSTQGNLLDFNAGLKLTEDDLNLMKLTVPSKCIAYHVERIKSAGNHAIATEGICGLMSAFLLPQHAEIMPEKITQSIRRYISTNPGSEADEKIFVHVVRLIRTLIEAGYDSVLGWVLLQLTDDCVFLKRLREYHRRPELYRENVKLLRLVIKLAGRSGNPGVLKLLYDQEIAVKLFDVVAGELKDCDKECIPSLVALLQTLTACVNLDTDEALAMRVITQLFVYIQALNPIAQTGSYVVKNCLFAIEHLLQLIKQPSLDKYLQQLSGLCSHGDAIIRAAAWNVLATYAIELSGAAAIVKHLAFLPGGIHSCIIATICDESEPSVVKGAVTRLFANLVKHKTDQGLKKEVVPRSNNDKPADVTKGYEAIVKIIRKLSLFEFIVFQLENFSPTVLHQADEGFNEKYATPPITVIHLCHLCIAIWDIRTDLIFSGPDLHALEMFLLCIAKSSPHISNATLTMTADICKLLVRHLLPKPKTSFTFIEDHPAVLTMLLILLDSRLYESEKICENTCSNVLQVVKLVARIPAGYQQICCTFDEIDFTRTIEFFNLILAGYEHENFLLTALDCLSTLLHQSCEIKNTTRFADKLDLVRIQDYLVHDDTAVTADFIDRSGSEAIMKRLIQLFNMISAKDRPKNGAFLASKLKTSLYNSMFALLKTTQDSRILAESNDLLSTIMDRLDAMHEGIGMTAADYIRKYGDKKKTPIIEEIGNIIGVIGAWYENTTLVNDLHVARLSKILVNLWPWAKMSFSSQMKFIFAVLSLSEDSILVCRSLSTTILGQPKSLLKGLADVALSESGKANNTNLGILQAAIGVMTNYCSCVEGRQALMKMNVLDVVSKYHPAVTKNQGNSLKIAQMWLNFWEVASRHAEANNARHLSTLCALIRKSNDRVKLLCLKIIRNFAFLPANRPALLSNEDFIFIVNLIFEDGRDDEKLVLAVCIWKLIANSCKAKQEIKSSSIMKRINACSRQLVTHGKTEDELFKVLTQITTALND